MNTTFEHKGKRILVPAHVQVKVYGENIVHLSGRYFYGGETKDTIILQPEPFAYSPYIGLFNFLFGISIGFALFGFLRYIFS